MLLEGDLRAVDLPTLLQWKGRDRVKILVERDGKAGVIYLAGGKVVHAELGDCQGEEAFWRLLQWEEGRFVVEEEGPPPTVTLDEDVSLLLLRGAHVLDEGLADEGEWVEGNEGEEDEEIDYEEVARTLETIPSVKRARFFQEDPGFPQVRGLLDALEELEEGFTWGEIGPWIDGKLVILKRAEGFYLFNVDSGYDARKLFKILERRVG